MRSLFPALLLIPAASLVAAGCTIYERPYRPPGRYYVRRAPPPQGEPQAQPAPPPPQVDPNAAPPPVANALQPARRPIHRTLDETTPRVTSATLFGDGDVTKAFRGFVYPIARDTTAMPDLSRLAPIAQVYTDRFDVGSQFFLNGFPGASPREEWFAIHYVGSFSLPTSGAARFRVIADDGAILTIDDKIIVDDDGVHAPKEAMSNASLLKAGKHTLDLRYFQGNRGQVALQVFIVFNGRDQVLVGDAR